MGAWAFYAGLVYLVWRQQLKQAHRTASWMWLASWSGLVLGGMLAAFVDRNVADGQTYQPWVTFNLIMWGAIAVAAVQVVLLVIEKRPLRAEEDATRTDHVAQRNSSRLYLLLARSLRSDQTLPLLFTCLIALLFSVRGMYFPGNFWMSFAAAGTIVALLTVGGFLRESGLLGFVSAAVATTATLLFVQSDPMNWFTAQQPYVANVLGVALTALAIIWCGYYVIQTVVRTKSINPRLVWMSNLALFLVAVSYTHLTLPTICSV